MFKRLFGEAQHKHLLIALINDLLGLEGDARVVDVQHVGADQRPQVPELKLSIVDVKATDALGRRFVVEMQVLNVEGFEKRVVYNVAKAYTLQLGAGERYPELADVVGITICDFELWPTGTTAEPVPMVSRWRFREAQGALGLPQLSFAFLELPKYAAGDAPQTTVERWAYFFRETVRLREVPEALSGEPFRGALEAATLSRMTPEEADAYDRACIAEQDARGALSLALKQGRMEGRTEGRTEGLVDAVLTVLAARGVTVSDEERARLVAVKDAAVLQRWLGRAVTVATAAELFADG